MWSVSQSGAEEVNEGPDKSSLCCCRKKRETLSAMGQVFNRQLLNEPWRTLPSHSEDLRDFVRVYRPKREDVKSIQILLHGPVGAGKSSFINSVESALRGRIIENTPVNSASLKSFTKKYKSYNIHREDQSFYPFVFNDSMGFEKNSGVLVKDLELALGGKVNQGYKFQTDALVETSADYNPNPTLQDRIHVLVCVVPAPTLDLMSPEVVKKMTDLREKASDMGIPQVALLTKVDEFPKVGNETENVYRSKDLKRKVEELHQMFGISTNHIFLVKNYCSEQCVDEAKNKLILSALKNILVCAEEFLDNVVDQ